MALSTDSNVQQQATKKKPHLKSSNCVYNFSILFFFVFTSVFCIYVYVCVHIAYIGTNEEDAVKSNPLFCVLKMVRISLFYSYNVFTQPNQTERNSNRENKNKNIKSKQEKKMCVRIHSNMTHTEKGCSSFSFLLVCRSFNLIIMQGFSAPCNFIFF